jgi:hypothetical protein
MSWAQGMEVIGLGKARTYLPMMRIYTGCENLERTEVMAQTTPLANCRVVAIHIRNPLIVTLDGNRRGIVEPNGKWLVKTWS